MRGRRLWLLAFALLAALPSPAGAAGPEVVQANLTGEINSITASYLQAVVERATADEVARAIAAWLVAGRGVRIDVAGPDHGCRVLIRRWPRVSMSSSQRNTLVNTWW